MADAPQTGRSFIGRGDAVEALHRRLDDLRVGSGSLTLLVGDAGVGKSALIDAFVREIRASQVRVLVGRSPPLDDPPPFSLLQSAIESAEDDPLVQTDSDPRLGGDRMLIGFAPGLGPATFPAPVGIEARLLEALSAGESRRGGAQERALSAITDRFLEYTRHGPTVLILEDLHRADRSSIAAVEFFARELSNRPLWILATARPAPSLSSTGRAQLESFQRATAAEEIRLRPMTLSEAGEFLRQRHPSPPLSSEELERRFSESGGNPYLLQQLDAARPAPGAGGLGTEPAGAGLDAESQEALDLASVLGPEFPFALLLEASGQDEERLAEEVDRLVGRGLLFEHPGELLEFSQDRLREEVYNYLSERRRRILHRRAGKALEAMGHADPSRVFALARHFYLGREGGKSVQYNRIAAEIAERSLAPEAAWDHFSRAIESQREMNPDDLNAESELVLGLARITEELGVLKESEEILREFLERNRDDARLSASRRAALEIFLARVLTDRGALPEAAELAHEILETPGLDGEALIQIGAHHQLGIALYYGGRYPEALEHHTREIEIARTVANPLVLARARAWRIAALAMLGETRQAIAEARELTDARDRLGSVRESAQAHLFLGDILADARSPSTDRHDAIGEFGKAIEFAEKAKDPRRVGWALYKTTELLREEGRLDEASERVERACRILGEMGDRVGLSVSRKVRGQIAMDRGDLDRAEADLAEALRLLEGTSHTTEQIDVLLRLGQLSARRGERELAERRVRELGELDLARVRPDLVEEFEDLRSAASADR